MLLRHFLNRVTDMHEHEITRRNLFALQHEKTYFTLDPACFAKALKLVNGSDLHRDGKAHLFLLLAELSALRQIVCYQSILDSVGSRLQYVITLILMQ
jgi:hypothetical protein